MWGNYEGLICSPWFVGGKQQYWVLLDFCRETNFKILFKETELQLTF
jgi:hypothetical protein